MPVKNQESPIQDASNDPLNSYASPIPGQIFSAPMPKYKLQKEILIDFVPEEIETLLKGWWNPELPTEENCERLSNHIAKEFGFLGYSLEEYEDMTTTQMGKARQKYYQRFSKQQRLSDLIGERSGDCTVYGLATGLTFGWPVFHKKVFDRGNMKPSRHTISAPLIEEDKCYIIDPITGYNMPPAWFIEKRNSFERRYFPVIFQ